MEPGYIGRVRTRNRIIKTASGYGLAEANGTVGGASIALYERLAKGGAGLIVFELTTVEYPRGARRPTSAEARMDDDRYIPGFTKLTNAVHKHGCPIFLQIMHSGPWYVPDEGREVLGERVSSSALPEKEFRELAEMRAPDMIMPRELSVAEIEDLIDKFAKTAERAQKAGFDGVEINGSHHHLVNCFFSTIWNRRHDAYGCDNLENRARFACGIVAEVKRRCEGLLAEDPFRLLPWLSQKGAIMLPGAAYERINDEGLVVKTKEGERLTLKADSIITALPLDPAPEAWKLPEEVKADVYRIGDCREPGFMHNAISDGFRVGIMI